MNPTAIFSKTGKGVQEASGKTSDLSRADRAVLKEIDGKTALANIAAKFEKIPADKFDALIQQFDKDGYIREVSSGVTAPQAPAARSAPAPRAAPPPASSDGEDEMDFTQAIKLPPKAAPPAAPKPPPMDLAAASRAETERKAKEQQAFDYKARQEAELKAKAQSEAKAKAEAELKARAAAEAKARAESEARARAGADAKALAEAEAKVKAAREAAIRMATEVKAKAEAEGKAKADAAEGREREALEKARRESEDKARLEAELTGKLEEERRAREDAERRAREAADQARKEMAEKAKQDADELRQQLEAEMKAKLEEERKAREAEDRKRREEDDRKRAEEDRKRREEDDRRRKEDEERRAKEEAERHARAEEDRKRREEDERRRKEEEEQRAKEDAERRAREAADREADRKRREEEDRKRAEEDKRRKEDEERRAKEEAGRRAKDEAERKAKEEAEAKARAAQAASAQSASVPSIQPVAAPPPPPADGGIGDSLLADLDSFGKREEEEQKAKEEAERKAKEEAARKAKAEAERLAKDDAERRAKEAAEKKRREEEERKAQEEAEQRAREEEERQKEEEDERKRKAKETLAAKEAERKAAQRAAAANTATSAGKDDDDIGVTDDDLGMDDVKKDQKALSAEARERERERGQAPVAAAVARRPRKWGKPAAIALFVLMIGGVGVLQLMPVSTAEYEKAASEAMGVPVKIGSARLSVITGIEARFESVSIGDTVKIRTVRGYPEVGSLFGAKKSFNLIELEGVSLSQSQIADAVLGKVSGENFRVARVVIKQATLEGPLTLPALDVDATVAGDGSLQSVSLRGPDKLSVQLSPKGNDIGFEISAGSLALPFAPALNLADFSMKGTANRGGVTLSEFDGRAFDGVISGSAKIRWGATWFVEGEVRARGVKVAVIAPALVSEGKVDGRGTYTMSGPKPATLFESARIQGEFKIDKGVLGSFDLTRALQTGGVQTSGRTVFSELTGQAVYDKGTVKVTNASITAGAMNAGASLDVDANGGLSGRIVADVKTPNQTLRATLNISGKIQDPVIRK